MPLLVGLAGADWVREDVSRIRWGRAFTVAYRNKGGVTWEVRKERSIDLSEAMRLQIPVRAKAAWCSFRMEKVFVLWRKAPQVSPNVGNNPCREL